MNKSLLLLSATLLLPACQASEKSGNNSAEANAAAAADPGADEQAIRGQGAPRLREKRPGCRHTPTS